MMTTVPIPAHRWTGPENPVRQPNALPETEDSNIRANESQFEAMEVEQAEIRHGYIKFVMLL